MVYEYPPSKFAENLTLTIVIYIVLLLAALLPLFFVWVRTKAPAKKSEIWVITAAMVLAPPGALVAGPSLPSEWVPFIVLYAVFFEIVSFVSLVVITRRLSAQGQSTSVVGIIGSLFGLGFLFLCLLPATPRAREAARRTQCSNNLKNIAMSLINIEARCGVYLPVNSSFENGPAVSWRVEVLPYLEHQERSWACPTARSLRIIRVARTLQCSTDRSGTYQSRWILKCSKACLRACIAMKSAQ